MIIEQIREKARKDLDRRTSFLYRDISGLVDGHRDSSGMPKIESFGLSDYLPTYTGKLVEKPIAVFGEGLLRGMVALKEGCSGCEGYGLMALLSLDAPTVDKIAETVKKTEEKIKNADISVDDVRFTEPYVVSSRLSLDSLSGLRSCVELYHAIQNSGKRELCVLNTSGPGVKVRDEIEKWDKPEFKEMPLEEVYEIVRSQHSCREFGPLIMATKHRLGFDTVTYVPGCEKYSIDEDRSAEIEIVTK